MTVTESVISSLIKQSPRLTSELYRALDLDRGAGLADHQRLTNMDVPLL